MLIGLHFGRQRIAGQRGTFCACPHREGHDIVTLQCSLSRQDAYPLRHISNRNHGGADVSHELEPPACRRLSARWKGQVQFLVEDGCRCLNRTESNSKRRIALRQPCIRLIDCPFMTTRPQGTSCPAPADQISCQVDASRCVSSAAMASRRTSVRLDPTMGCGPHGRRLSQA